MSTTANLKAALAESMRERERLRESEARYRELVENINELIYTVDAQGVITYMSPILEAILGYRPSEVIGRKFSEFVHPEDRLTAIENFQERLASYVAPMEYRVLTRSGEIRWLRTSSRPIYKDQQIVGVQGVAMDITEHKHAEETLREREARRREWLTRVLELGKTVAQATDWQECLLTIYESARFGLEFDRVGLFLYDQARGMVQGVHGTSNTGEREDTSWFVEPVIANRIFREGLTLSKRFAFIPDYSVQFPQLSPRDDMHGVKEHAVAAVWAGDRPVAVLAVDNLLSGRPMFQEQLEALELLAGYAGLAIENARHYAAAQRELQERTRIEAALQKVHEELEGRVEQRTVEWKKANARLQALYKLAQTISSALELDVVLNLIARNTVQLLESDTGAILLLDPAEQILTIKGAYGLSERVVQGTRVRVGQSIAGRVVQTGEPIIANDYLNDPRMDNPVAVDEGLLACASVPLVVGDKIIGTLDVHSKHARQAFNAEHIQMLQLIASQAAIVIENARLYAQLHSERNLLRTLIDNVPDEIYIKDTQGRFLNANITVARTMHVATPADLIGKTDFDFYPYDEAIEPYQAEQQIFETGEPLINHETYSPDMQRWRLETKIPLRDQQGQIVGLVGVNRFITDLKRADEELREHRDHLEELVAARAADLVIANRRLQQEIIERARAEADLRVSEERYRALYQDNPSMFFTVDEEGVVISVNQFGANQLGFTIEELEGQAVLEVFYPDDQEAVREQLQNCLRHPWQVFTWQFRKVCKDGRLIWVEEFARAVRAEEGVFNVLIVCHDITPRKRAEEEVQRRADEFAALYETTRELSTETDLKNLLQTIATRARQLLKTDASSIHLYDRARGDLELVVAQGSGAHVGTHQRLEDGSVGRVAQTRQPLIVEDYQTWPERMPEFAELGFRAIVQVPMLYGGELIGVLNVSHVGASTRRFTEADVRLLSLFASHAASAVHNARLYDETRHRLAELETVSRISAVMRAAQTLDEMLPTLLDEMLTILDTEVGSLWLYEPALNELHKVAARGWLAQFNYPHGPGEGIIGTVFATGAPHVAHEIKTDAATHDPSRPYLPSGWSTASVPIRTSQEVVGVLMVAMSLPREVTPDEVRLLLTLAEIAGNAIHRTRLHEETERQLARLASLQAIDAAISSSLDLQVTLDVVLEKVVNQLHIDAADVLLLNAHTQILAFAAGRGFRSRAVERVSLRLGEGLAGRATLERRLVRIANLNEVSASFARAALLARENFVAYLGVPLIAKGKVHGILEIFHRSPLAPDAEWLDFLSSLAKQAAIAIDNAELFDNLQRSNVELALAYDATIEGWSHALELRDKETEGHTQRVSEMALRLARVVGMNDSDLVHVRRGALLHDIGKMAIPDSILLKPGTLTPEEWAVMRQHPTYAYQLLSPIPYLRPALDIPYGHHEKWDGSGYPRGLKGEEIPLAARVFAVADVWDALRSERPYGTVWSEDQAREYLREQMGKQFDPMVVDLFLQMNV